MTATAEKLATDWYRFGMGNQVAVRLPKTSVDFVDELVRSGQCKSRPAVVVRALERERRRMAAERDAQILATVEDDPELAGLAEYVAALPLEID